VGVLLLVCVVLADALRLSFVVRLAVPDFVLVCDLQYEFVLIVWWMYVRAVTSCCSRFHLCRGVFWLGWCNGIGCLCWSCVSVCVLLAGLVL